MPVVRVSEENWRRLQSWAVPLQDRVDDVLTRVLDAAEHARDPHQPIQPLPEPQTSPKETPRMTTQTRNAKHLPQPEYRPAILRALVQIGGGGRTDDVCRRVFEDLNERFEPADLDDTSGGEVFWRNCTRWERNAMVEAGLLRRGSARGVWELTDLGRREAGELG